MRRALLDCQDRPSDDKARRITLTLDLSPVLDEKTLDCTEVHAKFHVASTVPKHRTKTYSFGLRRNGSLVFDDLSECDVNQATLNFEGDSK